MLKRLVLLFIILYSVVSMLDAQEGHNPFDLPNNDEEQLIPAQLEEVRIVSDNPFELQPNSHQVPQFSEVSTTTAAEPSPLDSMSSMTKGGQIGVSLGLVILLALLLTLFRGAFNDFLESAYRDRKFNQFFRRLNSMWLVPHILLYIFFFLSIGVFVHLSLLHYGYDVFMEGIANIGIISAGFGAYFLIKHILIQFLGNTFDVKNESNRYGLLILTFNIVLGVFLTPVNLLLLLGPDYLKGFVVIIGLVLSVSVLLLLLIRALSVSNRLLMHDTFHFFMYLCSIEIAPIFIILAIYR